MNSEETYITTNQLEDENYEEFFFDTYAFYEIIKENKNYKKYLSSSIVTTKLNIFELYLGLLKDKNIDLAETSLNKYYPFAVDFNEEVIKRAAKLKNKLNKRDISMTDCIGYCLAKQLGIKFLTGDKEFENFDNVEYVK